MPTPPASRPGRSIVCDAKDRVWIAYEEGDEQWGKDYANDEEFRKVGLEKNPGFALYVNRTVKVKCLADGKLLQPAGDIEQAMRRPARRATRACPRLAVDEAGGVWLLLRHHPLPGRGRARSGSASPSLRRQEVVAAAPPDRLHQPASTTARPCVPFGEGILAVYSGDNADPHAEPRSGRPVRHRS